MIAIVYTKYGSPEVLQLKEVEKLTPRKNEVCIKIFVTGFGWSDAFKQTPATIKLRSLYTMKIRYFFK